MVEHTKPNALDLFVLIAGAVIIVQIGDQSTSALPMTFKDLGVLSREMVLAVLLIIAALTAILMILTTLSLASGLLPYLDLTRYRPLSLVIGAELVIFGLAAINLSDSALSGSNSSIMPIGIELFCLGTLSMASFVERMGPSCILRNIPNHAYLLFFLALLPAAFFINF